MDDFPGNVAASASVICLTRKGIWQEWEIKFRISGAPIQPASLALRANRSEDSVQITASSALNGDISGAADGAVDFQFGIATVQFGAWVADASLTTQEKLEWWYDAGNIVSGNIFRPTMVFPDTARFNAVAVSNLPLSAEVLGLDPVRLPVDGRVPILRKGDVLVIHHTATTAPLTVSNAQTVDLLRERIARLRVIGADGNDHHHRLRRRPRRRHRHLQQRRRLRPADHHRAPHRGHGAVQRCADQRRTGDHPPADA